MFDFMGQVAWTKFWSLRLDSFMKMGSSHEGTWSPGLVAGTSRRDQSLRVCRPLVTLQHFSILGVISAEKMSVEK